MAKMARLTARTPQAGMALQQLFKSFPKWSGQWFILDETREHKGVRGNWKLIAPVGHPWNKQEKWVNASNDPHFNVCFLNK